MRVVVVIVFIISAYNINYRPGVAFYSVPSSLVVQNLSEHFYQRLLTPKSRVPKLQIFQRREDGKCPFRREIYITTARNMRALVV